MTYAVYPMPTLRPAVTHTWAAGARRSAPRPHQEAQLVWQEGHGVVARARTGVRALGAVLAAVLGASLAGYQAVDLLWLYKYNADVLGGGRPVLTGPQIITRTDAAELQDYTERGTR